MKTKLIIDDEIKPYLVEEIDRHTEMPGDEFAWQWRFRFENNYGASIVKHRGSYGFDDDLFELGILEWVDDDIHWLCYDTSIADDVIGYLTNEQVMDYLNKIKNL